MIEITRFTNDHLDALKRTMLQENLNFEDVSLCLDTLFVVLERDLVLGYGYSNSYNGAMFIDHLYIVENERACKLGDSLFRAILNSHNINMIEKVYMRNVDIYRGFLQAEEIDLDSEKNLFVIELPEFFNRKCKGSKFLKDEKKSRSN